MVKAAIPDATTPIGSSMADNKTGNLYTSTATPLTPMSTSAVPIFSGGSQPHENLMPYLGMYWIIAFTGVFPTRG
jgi:microcystin-dependent protein